MNEKPLILVTNDDGLFAPGIKALVEVVEKIGTPFIVAPDSPQSGMGHAITIDQIIRLNKVDQFGDHEAYECSGTPVDCVKLAKSILLKDRNVALCVSGINHGSNASINILYSGTMSAAMEASLEGVHAIGFSLLDYSFEADFTAAKTVAEKIIKGMLDVESSSSLLLNVNIPSLSNDKLKGIKICTQAKGRWIEEYQASKDPRGNPYYWLTGKFVAEGRQPESDIYALDHGYVSVVPSLHDLTKVEDLPKIKHFESL